MELTPTFEELYNDRKEPFSFNSSYIDYVIIYDQETIQSKPENEIDLKNFMTRLKEKDITTDQFEHPHHKNKIILTITVSFKRLCQAAEEIELQLPLKDCKVYEDEVGCFERFENKHFVTDNEDDFITAIFKMERYELFKGHEDRETFFRPALRNYLTHYILCRLDIRKNKNPIDDDIESEGKRKIALPNMLMREVFEDAFVLHDVSQIEYFAKVKEKWCTENNLHAKCANYDASLPLEGCPGLKMLKQELFVDMEAVDETDIVEEHSSRHKQMERQFNFKVSPDPRKEMDDTWTLVYKYQPLWKIRNYFGEQIAFYFAWSGHLVTFLWIPLILGLAVFFYGLYVSINEQTTTNTTTGLTTTEVSGVGKITNFVDQLLSVVKASFDNVVTPFFALSICIWSTLLTESWKRYRYRLAFEWDVLNFTTFEPDRPEFKGTHQRKDPVTQIDDWYYPFSRQFFKFLVSTSVLLIMILIVFVAVVGVIVYRLVITIRVCPTIDNTQCIFANTVASSLLNAVSILILGKIYALLARKLTDWENHRTQSEYENALIIKLFAFQFANSYSSLAYIAFFRGRDFLATDGILGLGPDYTDSCGTKGSCMPILSFQVLILMLVQPMPKLVFDIFLPFILRIVKNVFSKCRTSKIGNGDDDEMIGDPRELKQYIIYHYKKPPLVNFPIDEYMEKIIQYGYLVLFATSFPLAPILAMILCLFDLRIDAKRMLWMYRRPVAWISSGIGVWESILDFMNICAVVSNAFLIAYTSSWGAQFDNTTKLIIVLGVEHSVFAVKYILDAMIPDIPQDVQLNIRREGYQLQNLLHRDPFASSGSDVFRDITNLGLSNTDDASNEPPRHPPPKRTTSNGLLNQKKEVAGGVNKGRLPTIVGLPPHLQKTVEEIEPSSSEATNDTILGSPRE